VSGWHICISEPPQQTHFYTSRNHKSKKPELLISENNSSNTSILSHKMVFSNTENQKGLIMFGCGDRFNNFVFEWQKHFKGKTLKDLFKIFTSPAVSSWVVWYNLHYSIMQNKVWSWYLEVNKIQQSRKNVRSDCPEQVNFAPGQVKLEVWWTRGQVKLAPVVFLVIVNEWTHGLI